MLQPCQQNFRFLTSGCHVIVVFVLFFVTIQHLSYYLQILFFTEPPGIAQDIWLAFCCSSICLMCFWDGRVQKNFLPSPLLKHIFHRTVKTLRLIDKHLWKHCIQRKISEEWQKQVKELSFCCSCIPLLAGVCCLKKYRAWFWDTSSLNGRITAVIMLKGYDQRSRQ